MLDVSQTIVAKSDQLNADDLIAGPITVTITRVDVNPNPKAEQPVVVHIDGGHMPWKPSKTMRKVLVAGWGVDAAKWIGRSVTLVRNPDVKWAGKAVGGIEIAAMSDIPARIKISLAETKGKKNDHLIEVLKPTPRAQQGMSNADFSAECSAALRAGWTRDQVSALLGCKAADVAPERRRELVERLRLPPDAPPASEPQAPISKEEMAAILAAEKAQEQDQ